MSLIHQAIKKVQTAQRTDALPVYGEEAKGRVYFNLPAARARIILIVFSLLIAVFAVWLAIGRIGFLIPHRTVSLTPLGADLKAVSNGVIASPEEGHEKRFQTALEAARVKNMRGIELYKQGSFSLAKNEFLSSVEIFPKYAEAYNNLGLAYKQLGDINGAENSYKNALQYKPDYPEAMNNYGVLLEASGNSNAAKEYFKKAVLIASDYPDPYLNMAISLEKDKRFEQAISYYEGFLSRMKQGDDFLVKNVRERMLYLNANRFAVEKNR